MQLVTYQSMQDHVHIIPDVQTDLLQDTYNEIVSKIEKTIHYQRVYL